METHGVKELGATYIRKKFYFTRNIYSESVYICVTLCILLKFVIRLSSRVIFFVSFTWNFRALSCAMQSDKAFIYIYCDGVTDCKAFVACASD